MRRNSVMMLRRCVCAIIISFIICVSLIHAQPSNNNNNDLFPVPENLKPNVDFWLKVYTLYSSEQVIIHDSKDLRIIYQVVNFNDLLGNKDASKKIKWREIEKIKDGYRDILNKLAAVEQIDPELLNKKERQVYYLLKQKASPAVFRQSAKNIRGQQGLRDRFRKGLIRSGRYIDHIEDVFRKHKLPLELMALPHVESSFDYRAYSKFGAAGIWQFTRGTGRRFLRINYTVDERFDPIKSTEAAAKLLKLNYQDLGTWPLAISAYNHGPNGLKRAIRQLGTTDIGIIVDKYKSRNFKFASRNFYAEFIAALEASKNYKIYFGELRFEKPERFVKFNVPNYVKVSTIAKRLDLEIEDIKRLNPSLRNSVLSSRRRLSQGYELRIPWSKDFDPALAFANIPSNEKFERQVATDWYQVQRGDNLQKIARRFNTTISTLMELNEIENPHQIYVGQVIRLKTEETLLAQDTSPKQEAIEKVTVQKEVKTKENKTGLGDQITVPAPPTKSSPITAVAKKETSTEIETKETRKTIKPKTQFAENLPVKPLKPFFGTIYVQPEETLGHYADWLNIPTQVLRNLNSLRFGQDIQLDQKIKLAFEKVSEKEFQRKRLEYHRGIEEDFFTSYAVEGVLVHRIKSGENIWYLSNQVYEIPYWLTKQYNPNKNLERLNSGDELIIPVVVSTESNRSIG